MESFGDHSTSQYGSQASLNHDLLMMRRAQSFDVAAVTGPSVIQPQSPHHVRGLPMRQLSLNCPQQSMVTAPMSGPQGHQWAPQRSFDCSNNSYLCTGKHPMMRVSIRVRLKNRFFKKETASSFTFSRSLSYKILNQYMIEIERVAVNICELQPCRFTSISHTFHKFP